MNLGLQVPGTFHFSVLDNGVTSSEFWRIADCADDLSWALFYYAGAASVVGLTYRGAVLVRSCLLSLPEPRSWAFVCAPFGNSTHQMHVYISSLPICKSACDWP